MSLWGNKLSKSAIKTQSTKWILKEREIIVMKIQKFMPHDDIMPLNLLLKSFQENNEATLLIERSHTKQERYCQTPPNGCFTTFQAPHSTRSHSSSLLFTIWQGRRWNECCIIFQAHGISHKYHNLFCKKGNSFTYSCIPCSLYFKTLWVKRMLVLSMKSKNPNESVAHIYYIYIFSHS